MAMGQHDKNTVNLVPGLLNMSQAVDMPIFQLIDWKLENKTFSNNRQGISMVVVMKRKITSRRSNTGFGIWDLPQKSSTKAKFGTLGLNWDFFGTIFIPFWDF